MATVYNWLRAHPEFAAAYLRAKQIAFAYIVETAAEQAPWLGDEARSMRELARVVRAAHRRCAQIAPRMFPEAVYGPRDR